jgi:hypothetical protein
MLQIMGYYYYSIIFVKVSISSSIFEVNAGSRALQDSSKRMISGFTARILESEPRLLPAANIGGNIYLIGEYILLHG